MSVGGLSMVEVYMWWKYTLMYVLNVYAACVYACLLEVIVYSVYVLYKFEV